MSFTTFFNQYGAGVILGIIILVLIVLNIRTRLKKKRDEQEAVAPPLTPYYYRKDIPREDKYPDMFKKDIEEYDRTMQKLKKLAGDNTPEEKPAEKVRPQQPPAGVSSFNREEFYRRQFAPRDIPKQVEEEPKKPKWIWWVLVVAVLALIAFIIIFGRAAFLDKFKDVNSLLCQGTNVTCNPAACNPAPCVCNNNNSCPTPVVNVSIINKYNSS